MDMRLRLGLLLSSVLVAVLLPSATAAGAERWATPTGTRTSAACSASDPCTLHQAVAGAAAGDVIIVSSGTYAVGSPLEPKVPVTLKGLAGSPRPRLVGASNLGASVLTFKAGGVLRRLAVEATAAGRDALTMQGGLAEDLLVLSQTGDGAKIVATPAGTLLRDSVVRTNGAVSGLAALKLRESGGAGYVMLRNVTALAPSLLATGVRCEVSGGTATLVNTLARGGFRDAAVGDVRPAAGSPTIDAGTADSVLGSADPAGCPRTLGAAPDIGAYEFADASVACASAAAEPGTPPAEAGGVTPEDVIRGVPAPVIGRTVVVAPGRGKVLVRRPAGRRFRRLDGAARIPVGSVVDVRDGRVRLVSAVDAEGRLQLGTFWGSRFKVRQRRAGSGMTSLALRGGSFAGCPSAASGATAMASRRRRAVRRLWSRDRNGRFRTHGANSVATARGTWWLTEDRCDGTLTRVRGGAVAVRDRARHRTVLVKAGRSYFARTQR